MKKGLEIEDYVLTTSAQEAVHLEKSLGKKWFNFFWWILVFFMLLLAGRLVYLTIIKGGYYQQVSKANSIRSITIQSARGRIFDRSGSLLVNNIPSVDVIAVWADIPKDNLNEMIDRLSELLKINQGEILAKLTLAEETPLSPILIAEDISQEQMLLFLENAQDFPGIKIEKTAVRQYVDSLIFSHILGYEGKIEKEELEENPDYLLTDYIGKQGIEKSYEKYLRGQHGSLQVEVDSRGNIKREVGLINPVAGNDLILSIDAALEKKIYDSLLANIEKSEVKTAAAIALDPQTGEVLALVTLPSFDNNLFARKISQDQYLDLINNPDKPLFNRAISGEYAPGSTVKPVLAAAALAENVITPQTIVSGLGGVLRIGNFSFGDWKVHGPSDVRTAIAESNDIFFYTVGGGYGNIEGLGMSRMKKYYNMFGYGQTLGIDIQGEADGFIPDEQWKLDVLGERWYIGNSYHASIGQGYVSATPLQIVSSVATIANGGTLYRPHLVSQIRNSAQDEIEDIKPEVIRKVEVSSDILQVVREGMRKTVEAGTAQQLKTLPVAVAGKTGTAQFGSEDKTHAWFVSFAPYDDPQIAMIVLIEGSSEDHASAVPATKEIYDWYFSEDK